ncbi:tRNA-dihydrouridine synthase 2 [Tilletia horrida]|nr:tRNA-dihydrouridine synthase 2 [Tilletia horrida]
MTSAATSTSSTASVLPHLPAEAMLQGPPSKRQRLDSHSDSTQILKPASKENVTADHSTGTTEPKKKKERVMNSFRSQEYEDAIQRPFPVCTNPPDYRHGLFLAPMVRIGTLPNRLLSLQYGANLVWGPEIVDRAIMACERTVDPKTGLVDFRKDGKSIFTTHPVEKSRLIFQLGSANPAQAYEAIKVISGDVAGVDLNCGCPKPFSTSGGMGANLLTTPDLLCDILRAMRHAAPAHVAVTCKIRMLPTQEATIALVRQIVRTGVINAITIHCRTKEMRPREPALLHRFREVADAIKEESEGKIPVCVNGDCWSAEDEARFLELTGATSIMIARGAELNPSVFRREGKLSVPDIVAPQFAKYAMYFDNVWGNTKYCLGQLNFKDRANYEKEHDEHDDGGAVRMTKADRQALRDRAMSAQDYAGIAHAFALDHGKECARSQEDMLAEVRAAVDKLDRGHASTSTVIAHTADTAATT